MLKKNFLLIAMLSMAIVSCKEDEEPPMQPDPNPPTGEAPVNIILDSLPYASLEEYNFFIGDNMADLAP